MFDNLACGSMKDFSFNANTNLDTSTCIHGRLVMFDC